MTLCFPRTERPLVGSIGVPGDKSLAHRVALFAALAEGESVVRNYPDSGVTRAMRSALATLGVPSTLEGDVLRLTGNGFRPFPNSGVTAYCGNSATTFRLLAGALAGTGSTAVLDGSAGLRKRPMDRIITPLRLMGAAVTGTPGVAADGCPALCAPLTFHPAALHGVEYALPVASAQVLSCLQLAALGAQGAAHFTVPGPVRDHTERLLSAMGNRPPLRPIVGTLAGDISSAAFLFAAAALVPGSRVTVLGVGVNPTRTGFLDILAQMGASITYVHTRESCGEPIADVTVAVPTRLHGVTVAGDLVVRTIDEFPALAAVAACAAGETVVREAKELRYKETDRIAAIVTQLQHLGVTVSEYADGFAITGGTLQGGTAEANGDHRLAMAMALLGLVAPVTVEGAEILNESYPSFVTSVRTLCGFPITN